MAVELKETIDKRREEIMDACEKLYETKAFFFCRLHFFSSFVELVDCFFFSFYSYYGKEEYGQTLRL